MSKRRYSLNQLGCGQPWLVLHDTNSVPVPEKQSRWVN